MPPSRLHSFTHLLQSDFLATDTRWSFDVPDLPLASGPWIKSLELVSHAEMRKLELRFVRVEGNRATSSQPPDSLIHFSFTDFRLGQRREDGEWERCTVRETGDYLVKLLQTGVVLNGSLYSFYGHSNSQLKTRSCYLLRGDKRAVAALVESLGDFSGLTSVVKKAKRIGLLFSSCHALIQVPDGRYEDIRDVTVGGYTFTDGCGLVGKQTAALLSQKLAIVIRNSRYHPSVYQIRFRGYKGVVSVEPRMRKGCWFQFRDSMRKFTGTVDASFAVVEYSRPYSYGYLNDDIIVLLHDRGVSADTLLRKQDEHLQLLQRAATDPSAAMTLLFSLDRLPLVERLVLNGLESITNPLRSLITGEYAKLLNRWEQQRCRILIPQSRLLFGICDPRGTLEEGECFLRVTEETHGGGGRPRTLANCEVLVTRNPCLHPGDLRKLKAVDRPELAHLADCIVFSVQGRRPAADQMSGGDLDGDTFFVCWDPDLVPSTVAEPAEYPAGREPLALAAITADDRIEHFARYSGGNLGQIKRLFQGWAARKGAMSSECQELNRLHSLSVDGKRMRIPDRLQNLPEASPAGPGFILDVLHGAAGDRCRERIVSSRTALGDADCPRDVLETLLCQPRAYGEFHVVRLVHAWCCKNRNNNNGLHEFLPYFDLAALTAEQRHWLLRELPATVEYPMVVMNGLLHSAILSPDELAPFHLDYPAMRWKPIFHTQDRLANLFETVQGAFPRFHRKLLVLRIHNRLSVAIYMNALVSPEEETPVERRVRAMAFPHSQDGASRHGRARTAESGYRLFYDQNVLQLYKGSRANTFIFMGRPGQNDARYRQVRGAANRARARHETILAGDNHDWVVSINLGRFSAHLATQVGRVNRDGISAAELYVISNTDVGAFQVLDLWMDSVDTLDTTPLFEKSPPPLTIPQLATVDWSSQPADLWRLVGQGELSLLDGEDMQSKVLVILGFCFKHGDRQLPALVYRHYLETPQRVATWVNPDQLLDLLLQGLAYFPANVIFFTRLCPWEAHLPNGLSRTLQARALRLLDATIHAVNDVGTFAPDALRTILREIPSLSAQSFRETVQQAGLLVRDPAQLHEILLEVFQPASERLLGHQISPGVIDYFTRNLFGVALDHCEEASHATTNRGDYWAFQPVEPAVALPVLTSHRRLDAPQLERLATGDHVRFELARYPENVFLAELPAFDAVVESVQQGTATFRCLSRPAAAVSTVLVETRWCLVHCGSLVTANAMLDALVTLVTDREDSCALYRVLVESRPLDLPSPVVVVEEEEEEGRTTYDYPGLNECQNTAVRAALQTSLTCIWGPPGTGKTQTVAVIIQELLRSQPEDRVLITAPTHNAVDNLLKRYLRLAGEAAVKPLRVSTNIRKVDPDVIRYTCDGIERRDALQSNAAAKRRALERIQQARLVFTTCAGAGLGLLRDERFQLVILDESSQQTEPMSLIPLTKGCRRAVLVGDHVQLRATVGRYATAAADLEVSLFERLYRTEGVPITTATTTTNLAKVMLDIQYRMHPQICDFPSREFYQGRLHADVSCLGSNRLPPASLFPWPSRAPPSPNDHHHGQDAGPLRRALVPCTGPEDVGFRSKGNPEQVALCVYVHSLLLAGSSADGGRDGGKDTDRATEDDTTTPSIAILTPYTRQVQLLRDALPPSTVVSSIDGFQGREADIVIFVTVRCNPLGDIGFLSDLRRLNVVLTRARAGFILIGCPTTLGAAGNRDPVRSGGGLGADPGPAGEDHQHHPGLVLPVDQDSAPVWKRLLASLPTVRVVAPH